MNFQLSLLRPVAAALIFFAGFSVDAQVFHPFQEKVTEVTRVLASSDIVFLNPSIFSLHKKDQNNKILHRVDVETGKSISTRCVG
ncbi:MAG: hypothetical protein M3R08_00175 [Bacteroidota bacterium]|nr:hypothetical protein [Bacteroidota bacterium]